MATNIGIQQDNPPAARAALQPVHASGWLGGFANMFGKEMSDWFGTFRWLVQTIIWLAIINGFVAFLLWIVPIIEKAAPSGGPSVTQDPYSMGLQTFFSFIAQLGMIGVVVLTQDEVIGEKQTGTAQWVLSKPISRASFILSKISADIICVVLFIAAIPAVVGFGEIWLAAGRAPEVLNFVLALGVQVLAMIFYVTLVIMLGVFFSERAALLGVAFGIMFGGYFLTVFEQRIAYVLPVNFQSISQALALGRPMPDYGPVALVVTAAWCVVFTAVALWRFRRIEL